MQSLIRNKLCWGIKKIMKNIAKVIMKIITIHGLVSILSIIHQNTTIDLNYSFLIQITSDDEKSFEIRRPVTAALNQNDNNNTRV